MMNPSMHGGADLPAKIWLILGHRDARELREMRYSTDPRDYPIGDLQPMTDAEYAKVSRRIRVFTRAGDAIDFVYECGLETTVIRGYRWAGREYVYDAQVTEEVLDTDW